MAPHGVEGGPAVIACNPRVAGVEAVRTIVSTTDNQPPPRQEGETVVISWLRQVRDGASGRMRAREQLNV